MPELLPDVSLTADPDPTSDLSGMVVAVVGGHGGAGATVLAAALALVLSARTDTLLVDADRHGAGIEQVLGRDDDRSVRWDGFARSRGRIGPRSMRDSLPDDDGLSVLGWPVDRSFDLPAEVVHEVLAAARRAFGAVVVDVPRSAEHTLPEVLSGADEVLVVTTATLPAVAAAARITRTLTCPSRHLVVRGSASPRALTEIERLLGTPVLTRMVDQKGLDEDVDLGAGPLRSGRGPLARAATRVADRLFGDL